MSNPWEPIRKESADSWLFGPTTKSVSATCPQCHSRNCINVWRDGATMTYLCSVCDCEFSVEGSDERGVVRDLDISGDYVTYASLCEASGLWELSFNVADEVLHVENFEQEVNALDYYDAVCEAFGLVVPGAKIKSVESGTVFEIVDVMPNGLCLLSDGKYCYAIRFAVGIKEGKFLWQSTR